MLTRENQLSLGKVFEAGSVQEKAKEVPANASSVRSSTSVNSRQSGSGTKRVHTDGRSSTFPRGDVGIASANALEKSRTGGNSYVLVLSSIKEPLMPCTMARARELLHKQKAVVHRYNPFTIRLKYRATGDKQPVVLKIDPGSKKTGFALCRVALDGVLHPLLFVELEHRGQSISKTLSQRKRYRKRRRSANLRYRPCRVSNRTTPKGWLAPSLVHRVEGVLAWVKRLRGLSAIVALWMELVRFDLQRMQNPQIEGIEYQQGTLAGYEVREYLLQKWNRCCSYCGVTDLPLQVEHIQPRAKGGSDRISNLCLACRACNKKKGAQPIEIFLKTKPEILQRILKQLKAPLKDAASMNSTRWALFRGLQRTGLPVHVGSGGQTKFNRSRLGLPKTHCLDALCVGAVEKIGRWNLPILCVKSTGRGRYQRTIPDSSGFPRIYLMKSKGAFGFQTGDLVTARIPSGKIRGIYTGRVIVRQKGYFELETQTKILASVSHRHCTLIARADGYRYAITSVHARSEKAVP